MPQRFAQDRVKPIGEHTAAIDRLVGEGATASARIAQCKALTGHVPQVLMAEGVECSRS